MYLTDMDYDIEKYKEVSTSQFWKAFGKRGGFYTTVIDTDKFFNTIGDLNNYIDKAEWISGRFFIEAKNLIHQQRIEWEEKYYSDPKKKPPYTSFKTFCLDIEAQKGITYRTIKRHMWQCLNVAFTDADIGYNKNRMIENLLGRDEEIKKKFRQMIRDQNLSEKKVRELLDIYLAQLEDEAEEARLKKESFSEMVKKRILKKLEKIEDLELKDNIEIKTIKADGKKVVINCSRTSDAEILRDILIDEESKLKLKAWKRKKNHFVIGS